MNTGTATLVAFAGIFASSSPAFAQDDWDTGGGFSPTMTVIWLLILLAYFIPSFVAFRRQHPNRWAILVINTVFGGTGLGWMGSLIWAFSAVHRSPTGNHGGESGLNLFANDPVTRRLEPDVRQPPPERSTASAPDPLARLDQLKRLHASGIITDEEHAALRQRVLDEVVG